VLNALRHEPHPTHFTLAQALEVIAALAPRRAYLVHMTHNLDHADGRRLPPSVEFAYDGLEVTIES
jgi:phosphoribosyl 1,2-cyclic phosphate phosphodiesterase